MIEPRRGGRRVLTRTLKGRSSTSFAPDWAGHLYLYSSSGSNSVVECDLAKVEVAGSNPVSRSSFQSPAACAGFLFEHFGRGSQVEPSCGRERSGTPQAKSRALRGIASVLSNGAVAKW